ncbi:MAG: hypothetical protein JWL96_504, partial [Sphingomonas bacterium]|nr:hypothetical protein [Sphingomonas bacterium]
MLASVALILTGCGGGNASGGSTPTPNPAPEPAPTGLYSVPAAEALSVNDVQNVNAHAAAEATVRHLPGEIAVTDRVGTVLAVFRMTGARADAVTAAAPNGM